VTRVCPLTEPRTYQEVDIPSVSLNESELLQQSGVSCLDLSNNREILRKAPCLSTSNRLEPALNLVGVFPSVVELCLRDRKVCKTRVIVLQRGEHVFKGVLTVSFKSAGKLRV